MFREFSKRRSVCVTWNPVPKEMAATERNDYRITHNSGLTLRPCALEATSSRLMKAYNLLAVFIYASLTLLATDTATSTSEVSPLSVVPAPAARYRLHSGLRQEQAGQHSFDP